MRTFVAILLIFFVSIGTSQNSLRKFNEINPALESGTSSNIVYRNIFKSDAIYQTFQISSNKVIPRFNLGANLQSRTYDIKTVNQYAALLKGNYLWHITRKLSATTGFGIGTNNLKKVHIVPGIGFHGEYFVLGYNTNIIALNNFEHSIQLQYTTRLHLKGNQNKYTIFNIDFLYLNYWHAQTNINQYICSQVQIQSILLLFGLKISDNQQLSTVFGYGIKGKILNFNFQATLSKFDVTEMQISIKYRAARLTDRSKRRFRRSINLAEI